MNFFNESYDIGGYGELELPDFNNALHENAVAVQSARVALKLYLLQSGVNEIYLPDYICDSLDDSLASIGICIKRYVITNEYLPPSDIKLSRDSCILIVNYFGVLTDKIKKFIDECDFKSQVIIDNSQALFAPRFKGMAAIYSPRKFLGIPDGGYLYANKAIAEPIDEYNAIDNMSHLILRMTKGAKDGYKAFNESEYNLDNHVPKRMSSISKRLIDSYDLSKVVKVRIENYTQLEEVFGGLNTCKLSLLPGDVPLCYPLKLKFDVTQICKTLAEKNIYLPRYWKNTNSEIYNKTLFLPVDQRISDSGLQYLIYHVGLEIKISEL